MPPHWLHPLCVSCGGSPGCLPVPLQLGHIRDLRLVWMGRCCLVISKSLLVVGRDRLEDDRDHASRDPAGARTLPQSQQADSSSFQPRFRHSTIPAKLSLAQLWRGIDACRLTAIRSYGAAAYSSTEG